MKSIEKNGIYKLRANLPGCAVKDYLITVQNDNCKTTMYIPNVFTPNNDGINDEWQVHAQGFTVHKISIFNRIGEVLTTSYETNFKWNGELKNKNLPTGVYVYPVSYTHLGLITRDDLAKWKVITEKPYKTEYKGIEVYKLREWQQGPVMLLSLIHI